MSIEELEDDLKSVLARCPSGPLISAADVAKYTKDELLPLFQGFFDELRDLDDGLYAVTVRADDILHESTAQVFATVLELGAKIGAELKARIDKDRMNNTDVIAQLKEFGEAMATAHDLLQEITYPDPEDEDDPDAQDDGDKPQEGRPQ